MRYLYKLTIRFSHENVALMNRPNLPVLYSKYTNQTDTFKFDSNSAIRIEANRDFCLSDQVEKLYGNGNSIHTQILKAILLYCLTCNRCVVVKSITMSRKTGNSKTYYYQQIKKFKQPFPIRIHGIKPLPVDAILHKLGHTQRDYAYRIALSYLLREQYSLHTYHQFECLWRAYNCMFRNLTGKSGDNEGIKAMVEHVCMNKNKYVQTISYANSINLSDKMYKFKSFFEDKIEKSNKHCNKFKEFLHSFTKTEILDVFRKYQTAIDKKVDSISSFVNPNQIKLDIDNCINHTGEDIAKIGEEKFVFILWYAYFLRNMYFHAVVKEASFSLYSLSKDKHMTCINEFMEKFIYEIFQDDTF